MEATRTMKKVLCPMTNEKTNKTYWLRIGSAFPNRDGSLNVYLDAYPANGKLQIRDMDARDFGRNSFGETDAPPSTEPDAALPF
jgi:hypothetical protein